MIIDGRTIANHILAQLLLRVDELEEKHHIQPHMAVVRVGDDGATTSYVAQKEKTAKKIGAIVSVYNFPDNVTEQHLQQSIDFLQKEGNIHGIILQLPVPKHINYEKIIAGIDPSKDVDGFHPESPFEVPIANAILKILELPMMKETEKTGESFNEWLKSKKFVVMGKGKTGGQPIIDILKKRGAQVEIVDSQTQNPSLITQHADIIITAVGKPHTLNAEMIKKDAVLIGIGMSRDADGNFVGDYDENDIKDKASMYTPIPGGVGPVNVACLMENLITATEKTTNN